MFRLISSSGHITSDDLKMDFLGSGGGVGGGGGGGDGTASAQTEQTALCSDATSATYSSTSYPRRIFLECRYSSGMMTCSHGSLISLTPTSAKFSLLPPPPPPPAPPLPPAGDCSPSAVIDCVCRRLTGNPIQAAMTDWKPVTDDCGQIRLHCSSVDLLDRNDGRSETEKCEGSEDGRGSEEIEANGCSRTLKELTACRWMQR